MILASGEKLNNILFNALLEAKYIDDFVELLKNSDYYIIDLSEPKIYDLLGKINEIEDIKTLPEQVKIIQEFLKNQ